MASPKINNEPIAQMSVEKLRLYSKSSTKYKSKIVKELVKRKLDPSRVLGNEEV